MAFITAVLQAEVDKEVREMNTAELDVLEQVAVSELMAYSHRWEESGQTSKKKFRAEEPGTAFQALVRLEELGLITPGTHARSDIRPRMTLAGIEALAYLVATT
ncbi:hypothetical protein [Rhodococcus jostii]|uniref:hypothetical protein n=1 Tax=Rhodococcus jostii TaxID=132919 RepID=UPI003646667D